MKKQLVILLSLLCVIGFIGIGVKKQNSSKPPVVVEDEKVELPINTIPVEERPYITLTPDKSGRNLDLSVSQAPSSGQMEYEILYNAGDAQEGGLGAVSLTGDVIKKTILLGTRSAGGATTYHEGVTGGSLTVTYGETRLKEQFNFLRFDPADPSVSANDLRFSAVLPKTAFKKDAVVVVMKTFGMPGKLTSGKVVAGPYGFFTPEPVKGSVEVSLKLPAGDYQNVALYAFVNSKWTELKTTKKGTDTLVATVTGASTFIAVEK